MARNRFLVCLLAFGVAAVHDASAQSTGEIERAKQLLLKTLDRTYPQNVVAIIMQRTADGSTQRIQVQINREGKMRQTVIYPLSLEGVETIDDCKQSATFLPDDNLVIVQESPKRLPNDASTRILLFGQNYALRLGGTSTIAGQTARIVIATPKAKDLETRRYYIDESSGFLLQLDTVDESGRPKVAFTTQSVSYPTKIQASTFQIDLFAKTADKVIYKPRSNFFSVPAKGETDIGFTPVIPQYMPYGFELQDAQINDSGQWKSVAIRITDGPIKATVYQWPVTAQVTVKVMTGTSMATCNGLKIVVAADIPELARKKILTAFVEAARRLGYQPPMGLTGSGELCQFGEALARLEALIFGMNFVNQYPASLIMP